MDMESGRLDNLASALAHLVAGQTGLYPVFRSTTAGFHARSAYVSNPAIIEWLHNPAGVIAVGAFEMKHNVELTVRRTERFRNPWGHRYYELVLKDGRFIAGGPHGCWTWRT